MGSFKANGGEQGPNRRRAQKQAKRRNSPRLESLENRLLLTGGDGGNPVWKPSSTNLADVQNGPMANLGGDLIKVYETYIHSGGNASKLPAEFPLLQFKGSNVFIGVNDGGGDFNGLHHGAHQPRHADCEHQRACTGWTKATCRSRSCRPSPRCRRR